MEEEEMQELGTRRGRMPSRSLDEPRGMWPGELEEMNRREEITLQEMIELAKIREAEGIRELEEFIAEMNEMEDFNPWA